MIYHVMNEYAPTKILMSGTYKQCRNWVLDKVPPMKDGRKIYRQWSTCGVDYYDVGEIYGIYSGEYTTPERIYEIFDQLISNMCHTPLETFSMIKRLMVAGATPEQVEFLGFEREGIEFVLEHGKDYDDEGDFSNG